MKHTTVFNDIGHATRPLKVYIAELNGNRLGKPVTQQIWADYAGNLSDAIAAFDKGDYKNGNRIFHNLP